jgi:hypothetical protein
MMRKGIDPSKEVDARNFNNRDIVFTDDPEVLKQARFFIVAVPTPVDKYNVPDLKPLIGASTTVGKATEKGRLRRLRIHHLSRLYRRRLSAHTRKDSGLSLRNGRLQPRLLPRTHQPGR